MCVNYITVSRQVCLDWFRTPVEADEAWRDEIYQDYTAPFIIHDENGNRKGLIGSYGFVPQRHKPPPMKTLTTMNARAETVGALKNYKKYWVESRLCLVPGMAVFEPNWETGKHVRWAIGLADKSPFAMAGMWRSWEEPDGSTAHSFTQLTVNADDHDLMRRFHKPGDEKRSVVILRPDEYDDWLSCKNPEMARTFLNLLPANEMSAYPAPRPSAKKAKQEPIAAASPEPPTQEPLF